MIEPTNQDLRSLGCDILGTDLDDDKIKRAVTPLLAKLRRTRAELKELAGDTAWSPKTACGCNDSRESQRLREDCDWDMPMPKKNCIGEFLTIGGCWGRTIGACCTCLCGDD